MPRVLMVDDSRALRSIVTKHLREWEFEVIEAEDGEKGLEKLAETSFDLVLLDVTMPVMDGTTMLARLRERGDRTPVLMLTSEAKRSIVSTSLKLGIEDYILKPFKPEELRAKVAKALRVSIPSTDASPTATQPGGSPTSGKQALDVLVIDDMENVHKKLRSLLPAELTMASAATGPAALACGRDQTFRLVVIDNVMPDVSSQALMHQIRAFQPQASFISLGLRSNGDVEAEARRDGFDGFLFKPLTQDNVNDLVERFMAMSTQGVISVSENYVKIAAIAAKDTRYDRYYEQLTQHLPQEMEKVAEACFEDVVLDAQALTLRSDRTVRFILRAAEEATRLGLTMQISGTAELSRMLREFVDSASIPFDVVQPARTPPSP